MAAILINIKSAETLPNLRSEGATLSKTLLPYLNTTHNYSYISTQLVPITITLLQSLALHIKDTDEDFNSGFVSFALTFSPQTLQNIILSKQNKKEVVKAFSILGYPQEACEIISKSPTKFLWPDLLKFLSERNQNEKKEIVLIISKLKI